MGILEEIRDLAADDTVPLERVLLRCMVLADILGDETLMNWVSQELDGYRKRSDLPNYRFTNGRAWAKVTNGVRYEKIDVSNIALPAEAPDDAYERLNSIAFTDGVRELEQNQARDDLVRVLDQDLVYIVEQNLRSASGYRVQDAYIPIAPGAIAGILSSIRSRVLQYVFRLRRDYPDFDRNETSANAPSREQLNQVFQITIAQGSAITIGGGNAYAQNIGQQIVAGDLDSLKKYLRAQGVEQEDLAELDVVIAEATAADVNDEQSRMRRWIDNVAQKASGGGVELAKTATKELIQVAIKYYFGTIVGQ